jgi:hypothetical protein
MLLLSSQLTCESSFEQGAKREERYAEGQKEGAGVLFKIFSSP